MRSTDWAPPRNRSALTPAQRTIPTIAAGNVLSSTDAAGIVATYSHDALNRITSAVYAAPIGSGIPPVSIAYSYDQGSNGIGRLTGVSDATGSTGYTYDQKGRLIQDSRVIGGVTYVTRYSYDSAGRLIGLTYPGGRQVNYALDALGRIAQITTSVNGQVQTVLSSASYRPFGGVQSFTFGNTQPYIRAFDLDGRISGYTLGNQSVNLGYDAASRIVSQINTAAPTTPTIFGYDNLDRLSGYTQGTTSWSYQYDVDGNRTALSIGGNRYPYAISPTSNQLTNVAGPASGSYSYDATGNLISSSTLGSFGYDARHRLIQNTLGTTTVNYQVNALGQRVKKSSSANATVYHYDKNGKLIAESDVTGAIKASYVYLNDLPVAVIAQNERDGACEVSIPQVDSGTTFVPFDKLSRFEVRSGRPNNVDWQWGLGVNTHKAGRFTEAYLNWVSGRVYHFTLKYNGQGSGTYTVSHNGSELFSKSWQTGLRVGNALQFFAKSAAGIGVGNFVSVSLNTIDGAPINALLRTAGDDLADQVGLTYVIPAKANGAFTVRGTISFTFIGRSPPAGSRMDFRITAGNVSCSSSSGGVVLYFP